MDPKKKKNIILVVVALVLIAGAVVFGFWDSLFAPKDSTTPEVRAAVEDAAKHAEPVPAEPIKSNFSKRAGPAPGR